MGSLCNLEPPLSAEMRDKCTKALFPFYDSHPDHMSKDALEKDGQVVEKDGVPLEPVEMTLHHINAFLTSVIHMEPTVGSLITLNPNNPNNPNSHLLTRDQLIAIKSSQGPKFAGAE